MKIIKNIYNRLFTKQKSGFASIQEPEKQESKEKPEYHGHDHDDRDRDRDIIEIFFKDERSTKMKGIGSFIIGMEKEQKLIITGELNKEAAYDNTFGIDYVVYDDIKYKFSKAYISGFEHRQLTIDYFDCEVVGPVYY